MIQKLLMLAILFQFATNIVAQHKPLWQHKTKGRVYSSPVINNDIIYFGGGDHNFYALNKHTGKTVWTFKTQGAVHSSPTINNNNVYFSSHDGNIYALNKITGTLIWKFASKGEKMFDLWDYYLSSPIVDSGLVYWGSGDSCIYALDEKSGKLHWKFKTENIVHASPAINKNQIIIGGFDGYLYCINKKNGELNWKFKTVGAQYFPNGDIQKAALVKEDVIYTGSRDYNMYAINAITGRANWNMRQLQGWIIATPTIFKDYLYFGTSDAHLFYCMNKKSGEIIWTKKLNMRVYGSAIIKDSTLYFGTFDGKVLGVDYKTGNTQWEFQTEASKNNYASIYNEKGEFKAGFELYGSNYERSEAMIHNLGSVLCTPIIDNNIIYFGSSDGNIYAVPLK